MKFSPRKKTENLYFGAMKSVIKRIEEIINAHYDPNRPTDVRELVKALNKYAETLTPWAKQTAKKVIDQVNMYNLRDWFSISAALGRQFKKGYSDPKSRIYALAKKLQDDEVKLITSLPKNLAKRAQALSRKYLAEGLRHEELADRILAGGKVAKSRAQLIARTEIAKANTFLIKSRCSTAKITQFVWRTARDEIVRPEHAELEGKVFDFSNPPQIPGEGRHLPGAYPNCRCYPEPVITVPDGA